MTSFKTAIRSARFVYSPYTATEIQGFAQVLADSIRARIQSGQNIYDQAANASEAWTAGPTWFSGLQGRAQSQSDSRLDLERAYITVPQGLDGERESRGDRVPR